MSSNKVEFDIRENTSITEHLDIGVSDVLTISSVANVDVNYTYEVNGIVKNVANNKIILGDNSISIVIDSTDLQLGNNVGYLISDSNVAGVYKNIKINLIAYKRQGQ